jgi:hypothetical protein
MGSVNPQGSVYLCDTLLVAANFEKGKNNRSAPVIMPAQTLYEIFRIQDLPAADGLVPW